MPSIPSTSGASPTSSTFPSEGSSNQPNPIDMWNSSGGGDMTHGMTVDLKSAAGDPSGSSGPPQDTNDLNKAMMQVQQKDPKLFSDITQAAQSGDGNTLAKDIDQAYKNGDLSKGDASQIESGIQAYANDHGGGKINDDVRKEISTDFGSNLIQGGHERSIGQVLFGS